MIWNIFKTTLSNFWKKATSAIGKKISDLFSKKIDEETFEKLEQLLYEADLGVATASELSNHIRSLLKKRELTTPEILTSIKEELLKLLDLPKQNPISTSPHIILIVGVNGSGKTTSLAKLARHYKNLGKKVLIAAADTYRAAAIEQLETWAEKLSIDIVKAQRHGDAASVAFDALQAAKARNVDIVLIDTAGRLQTKKDLMQELEKLQRVCKKVIPEAPHETLLVLDSTTGQNAVDQAEIFHSFTPLTGLILTKLDGSAKGGIIIAIAKKLKLPVVWVGTGEKAEDLLAFDPQAFVEALIS